MRNFLIITFLLGIMTCANAQNIIQINQNINGNNSQDDCGFRINGICSSEDIGGVSLERITFRPYEGCINGYTTASLKNYNNFTVTVLIKLLYDSTDKGGTTYVDEVHQVVIPSNETKSVSLNYGNCPACYTLQGMIVRRLSN